MQAGMLIGNAGYSAGASRAALWAAASVLLAACAGSVKSIEMTPELRDGSSIAERQVAIKVGLNGQLEWEGRRVSAAELDDLMRDAALGSPRLLLVVVPVSGDVRYGDIVSLMQMARARGIEAKLAEPRVNTE